MSVRRLKREMHSREIGMWKAYLLLEAEDEERAKLARAAQQGADRP